MVPASSRGYVLNDVELKSYDEIQPGVVVGNNLPTVSLFVPILGSDIDQRIGRKVTVKSLSIRGVMQTYLSAQAAPTAGWVTGIQGRFIVAWDAQPNGQLATADQILKAPVTTISQPELNYRDRFRILFDECFTFDPYFIATTGGSVVNQIQKFKLYKKMNDQVIFNSTNGGTFADITTGNIVALWVGDTNGGTPAEGLISTISTRVRFSDC